MNWFIDCKTVVFSCIIRLKSGLLVSEPYLFPDSYGWNRNFWYLNRIPATILTVEFGLSDYRTVPAVHLLPKLPAYVWNDFRFVWKIPEAKASGIRILCDRTYTIWLTFRELRSSSRCFESVLKPSMCRFSLVFRGFPGLPPSVVLFLSPQNRLPFNREAPAVKPHSLRRKAPLAYYTSPWRKYP